MVCFFSFCKRLGVGFVCLYLDFLHTVLKHLCFTIRKDTRHVRFCYSVSNMTFQILDKIFKWQRISIIADNFYNDFINRRKCGILRDMCEGC